MRKTKLLSVILFSLLVLNTFAVSGVAENSDDLFINEVVEKINEDDLYLGFISESKYNSVKLIVEEDVYYFEYNNLIEIVEEIEEPDVVIKLSSEEFDELIKVYENNNLAKLKRMVFKTLPFKIKISVFFQCLRTD